MPFATHTSDTSRNKLREVKIIKEIVYQFFKKIFLILHFRSYLLSNLHQKYGRRIRTKEEETENKKI